MAEESPTERTTASRRTDVVTATIALVLFAAISLYQVWDLRAAVTDFDGWWTFFKPV